MLPTDSKNYNLQIDTNKLNAMSIYVKCDQVPRNVICRNIENYVVQMKNKYATRLSKERNYEKQGRNENSWLDK